jgi:flagellar assembly protein FliH
MGTQPRKFLFDLNFDQPQKPIAVQFARTPLEPSFSKAELEVACAKAAAEARAAALTEAAATTEARLADATDALAAGIASVLERERTIRTETERHAAQLLRAIVAKAVPALARRDPLAEIEAVVGDCLREVFDEPRVVLRVAEPLFDAMRQRLSGLAQQSGFAGKFVLLVDDTLGPDDCRLEWADGGAERNLNRIEREIDGILARALLADPAATPSPSKEPHHE